MAQAPAAPPDSIVLNQFTGLRNTVTRERLGPADLYQGKDVDLDDAGQLRRRRGRTKVGTGSFHSLYEGTEKTLVVKDGVLCRLWPNYTTTALLTGAGDWPVSYVPVGPDIYFASEVISGILGTNDTVSPWGYVSAEGTWLSPVVTPTDTLHPVAGKLLGPPPMATALTCFNGRIYLASGRTLWATELYLYSYVDRTKNYLYFEDDITALGMVDDGIYVGTQSAVWFLSGPFGQMKRTPAAVAGVLPRSMVVVPRGALSPEVAGNAPTSQQDVVMFMTNHGMCVGLNGGAVVNLTMGKVDFPYAVSASAVYRQQDSIHQYVAVADSGGTPSSTARIGDYVDAEIIRHR